MFDDKVKKRFWAKVDKSDDCWIWTASKNWQGYGRLSIARHKHSAHRVSWTLTKGTIPAGLCVLHSCDNPSCVNPDHLFLGAVCDNNADRSAKGRNAMGDRHGRAKITEDDVRAIRKNEERTQRELAEQYGLGQSTIQRIQAHTSWVHVK